MLILVIVARLLSLHPLLFLGLFLVLGGHVMTNRTAAGCAENTVVRHVSGDASDDGTLDAALGLDRTCGGKRQDEGHGGR
jgi:hypothetical protein